MKALANFYSLEELLKSAPLGAQPMPVAMNDDSRRLAEIREALKTYRASMEMGGDHFSAARLVAAVERILQT